VPLASVLPNPSWGDAIPHALLQRTLDKDCRQAEEPKQLVDEASQFHLGRQRQHSVVISLICFGALLFSSRVLRHSLITLCSHKSGRCVVKLYHAPHFCHSSFYTSAMTSVLSNIEPPALQRKAATDKLVEKIVKHDSWPIQPDILILNPPLL